MARAGHRPTDTPASLLQMPRPLAWMVATAAFALAAACLHDDAVAPSAHSVQLDLHAAAVGGRAVAIDVFYRRTAGSDEAELVALESSPTTVDVEPGTIQVPVTVRLTECFDDPDRLRDATRPDGCALVVDLRLLDADGEELDRQRVEPAPSTPGETVDLEPVVLRQPVLVLGAASLAFAAQVRDESPIEQHIDISNGGGGSLGSLSAEVVVEEESAAWLTASIAASGDHVIIRPATTDLSPVVHSAIVRVHATGAANSPQSIEVIYQLTPIPVFTLSVGGTGNGAGRIASQPAGIDCALSAGESSGTCAFAFEEGTAVSLEAVADDGSGLTSWSGACAGAEPCVVAMDAERTVAARFERTRYRLTVRGGGNGTGFVKSPDGVIDCTIRLGTATQDGACSAVYDAGSEVVLRAYNDYSDDDEQDFAAWTSGCTSIGEDLFECTVLLKQDTEVVAEFALTGHVSVQVAGARSGRVTSTPGRIDCTRDEDSGPCDDEFGGGTVVTLVATPDESSVFLGWSGDCSGSSAACALHIDRRRFSATATFGRDSVHVSLALGGDGEGTIVSTPEGIHCVRGKGTTMGQCDATFPARSTIVLTASAGSGDALAAWGGACLGRESTCTIALGESHHAAYATFLAVPSESDWIVQSSGTTNTLHGVWGSSSDRLFAVGAGGTILRYDGEHWYEMDSGTGEALHGVWGSSSFDVFVVGSRGTILRYDGCGGWTPMKSGTTADLYAVWGTSANDVIAVGAGGVIRRWNGTAWTSVASGTLRPLHSVWGSAATNVLAVGHSGTIRRWTGTGWTGMSSTVSNDLEGIWGASSTQQFAVGSLGTVLRSSGTQWTSVNGGTYSHLRSIAGFAASNVVAVGDDGQVIRFDGQTWRPVWSGTSSHLLGVFAVPGTGSFVTVGAGGVVLRSVAPPR